ncbi:MAG: SsrA-binding protein SmpB [Spirochaetales bacterium]|jgi:SsrA-binding protein|nr:SsrA-binding protein SmpB [Spirochaetales bacterium]
MAEEKTGVKVLATNRRARYQYQVDETMECGIALAGTEVKSVKLSNFSFSDAYGRIKNDELWMIGFHISPYKHGSIYNHEPDRERKLLAHKKEIVKLRRKIDERGFTLIPLKVYMKKGLVKVELGICRGKKLADKRQSIKERDQKRDADREIRDRS